MVLDPSSLSPFQKTSILRARRRVSRIPRCKLTPGKAQEPHRGRTGAIRHDTKHRNLRLSLGSQWKTATFLPAVEAVPRRMSLAQVQYVLVRLCASNQACFCVSNDSCIVPGLQPMWIGRLLVSATSACTVQQFRNQATSAKLKNNNPTLNWR